MELAVEGHVNFGQKPASALKLSKERAERVMEALVQQGVAPSRLRAKGYGYERPRFPRKSPFAKKNRRVEFRVLPGSGLFTRLHEEAEARRKRINSSS